LVYLAGQYLIVRFIKNKFGSALSNLHINVKLILRLLSAIQYALAGIIFIVFLQVLVTSSYDSILLKAGLWISYLQAIAIIGFLSYKFFSWWHFHRSRIVFMYALAIMSILANATFTIVHLNDSFAYYPETVVPHARDTLPYVDQANIVTLGFHATSIASYLMMWVATVVLLRNHYAKIGSVRYWLAVSVPLIYFVIQFQPIFLQMFASYRLSEPMLFGLAYTLFFSVSKPIGGFLFGIAIWGAGNKLENQSVKGFMQLAAYGIILFFISNQAIVLNSAPYPPFGLAAVSLLGLASFLILIGFYSSAISIAQDAALRNSIRKSLQASSAFLGKIGTSEMEHQIVRRVFNLSNKLSRQMEQSSGVQSSLQEEDIKDYISFVVNELKEKEITH
jgi:hypothetical protein